MKFTKNQNTERAFKNYTRSEAYSLYGIYDKFSMAKSRAWQYCEDLCKQYNGYNLKAISGNTFTFSAGFTFKNENGQTIFCYITPSKNQFYIVND